ncbi:hypothetical protein PANDA_012115 [Ailuropoda melanoleuca]|uniref:CUB domain-containing protein n=1 Tax=Ailuropoda melanoleuca TaxID=9646 RepID=D2HL02_AILME|nr:hypothetical protein PANDA_012115 [Ailuropoda melanoleuca]
MNIPPPIISNKNWLRLHFVTDSNHRYRGFSAPYQGSSTLAHTTSTGELEEHNRTTTGAFAVASTSADVTVSSVTAVTIHRLSEEQRVQVTNLRNSGLDPNTSKDGLSPHQADTQSTRRRPRNAEQIERTKELAVVTHRDDRLNIEERKNNQWYKGEKVLNPKPGGEIALTEGDKIALFLHLGSTVQFSCDEDYVLQGAKSITCQRIAEVFAAWSDHRPVCKACQADRSVFNDLEVCQLISPPDLAAEGSLEVQRHLSPEEMNGTAEYHQVKTCGSNLQGPSGTFTSPNFPFQYDSNAQCVWVITAVNTNKNLEYPCGDSLLIVVIRSHQQMFLRILKRLLPRETEKGTGESCVLLLSAPEIFYRRVELS